MECSPAPVSSSTTEKKGPKPFLEHPSGVQWDYKYGARVIIPSKYGKWEVRLFDHDRNHLLSRDSANEVGHDGPVGTLIISTVKFFIRWRVEVDLNGEPAFTDIYDARNQPVFLSIPSGLGDTLSRMRAVKNFVEQWQCKPTVCMSKNFIPLFEGHRDYKDWMFYPYERMESIQLDVSFYAGYAPGFFMGEDKPYYEPYDHRIVPNIDLAAYMLGQTPDTTPPRINIEPGGRPIKDKYVCIARKATTKCKEWNYPGGWRVVEDYLQGKGYKLFVVDDGVVPLVSRGRLIRYADFFIGSTGGMGWMAWALGVPLVTISGFSNPSTSFVNKYHVTNPYVCNSCFNRVSFDANDPDFCPDHKGTPRQWECSKQIHPQAVIHQIDRLIQDLRNKR